MERIRARWASGPRHVVIALVAAGALVAGGCGDDGGEPVDDEYCEAGAELEESIQDLVSFDLLAEGTDGLESRFEAIDEDLDNLRDSAGDAADDEIDALEDALDELGRTLATLGDISEQALSDLSAALQDVGDAAEGVYDTLSDCP